MSDRRRTLGRLLAAVEDLRDAVEVEPEALPGLPGTAVDDVLIAFEALEVARGAELVADLERLEKKRRLRRRRFVRRELTEGGMATMMRPKRPIVTVFDSDDKPQ